MPWSGLEPLRLAAPPPQDGVSTNFTTRAITACCLTLPTPADPRPAALHAGPAIATGPTGLEPATSRVTVECSNQTELRPLCADGRYDTACAVLRPALLLHAAQEAGAPR